MKRIHLFSSSVRLLGDKEKYSMPTEVFRRSEVFYE